MTINILGTPYEIIEKDKSEDQRLEDALGFTDWTTRQIIIDSSDEGVTLSDFVELQKKVKRHEIVHAFLLESGLHECSGSSDCWAANEVMVDWFARQGIKIYKAWMEADAL